MKGKSGRAGEVGESKKRWNQEQVRGNGPGESQGVRSELWRGAQCWPGSAAASPGAVFRTSVSDLSLAS